MQELLDAMGQLLGRLALVLLPLYVFVMLDEREVHALECSLQLCNRRLRSARVIAECRTGNFATLVARMYARAFAHEVISQELWLRSEHSLR